jgi:major vault protein
MQVYEVEVLKTQLVNDDIDKLISNSQRAIIQTTIALANQRRTLEAGIEEEKIKQQMAEVRSKTNAKLLELAAEEANLKKESDTAVLEAKAEVTQLTLAKELEAQSARNEIAAKARENDKESADFDAAQAQRTQDLKIAMIQAEIKSVVEKSEAIGPDLISALQAFGDKELVLKAAEAMAPLAILGGASIGDVLSKLLAGTKLASVAKLATENPK